MCVTASTKTTIIPPGRNVNLVKLHIDNNESLLGKTAYLTGFGIINGRNQYTIYAITSVEK